MKVFTSKDFRGHYPVPVAAVVIAPNEIIARAILESALKSAGLPGDEFSLQELGMAATGAVILSDGNY